MQKGGRCGSIGRRGMSPLIATVLLMAFAVALGAFIMNITIDNNKTGACDTIKVTVSQFCRSPEGLHLSFKNEEESIDVREFSVVYTQGSIENTLKIRDSTVTAGAFFQEVVIPVTIAEGTPVNLIAGIGTAEDPVVCTAPVASLGSVPNCS